ncbi:thiamine phosphate synthase [Scatolibacter rhodanostii]|uniref:thiamine phosphate synthase n=1 Tax=Scatolibacter rhodanostii TaxID=2014781 RepID=UPI000C086385|nr:thiamine phosphate synthase [Scatolibacter rhodanostii]
MKCNKNTMLLYAVTDRAWVGKLSLYEQVKQALQNGATCIQLREKDLDEHTFLAEAIELAKLCKQHHVPFIINDNVEIAIACDADGIHVGQEDMLASDVRARVGENMIIGVSAHTVEEALCAVKSGADYLGLGAVFSTSTKTDVNLMSYETLKDICSAVSVPTVAIGGISKENILQLSGSGVDGAAVVSAIFGAENPGEATAELLTLAKEMVQA